ncbi:hypothetical protein [Streptomyces sp. NPDC002057]|uniref:hypothetical protein n=1 Tax=Streptomyces sp. NPDC002057 TaxID=3154664 RepID=UPI00332FB606
MTTTPAPATTPDTRALRLAAAGGLLLLAVCFVCTCALALADAVGGDGVGGGFLTAGMWALGLGALTGAAALIVPRRGLVIAAYVLAVAGPLLALMD